MNFQNQLNKLASSLDKYLKPQNSYLVAALTIFVILYGTMAAPRLPKFIADLFDNALFRLFVLFLIAYLSVKNITVSIIVAVVFTLVLNFLNEQRMMEGFASGMAEGQKEDSDLENDFRFFN